MPAIEIHPTVSKGTFLGLAKQNLLFHQALGELIDNSIAAHDPNTICIVNIFIDQLDKESFDFYIFDNSCGMNVDELRSALDLGRTPTSESRLNEHGFGMKNAIATLTNGENDWKIWTKKEDAPIYSIKGPFDSTMTINDDEPFPDRFTGSDPISTLTYCRVNIECLQTIQGRGAKGTDIDKLRIWLIEHLSVMYRGLLTPRGVKYNYVPRLAIKLHTLKQGSEEKVANISPAKQPMISRGLKRFNVELSGQIVPCEYEYGVLDTELTKTGVYDDSNGEYYPFRSYYLNSTKTQGIDISIDGRTIANSQFDAIWKTTNGEPLARHNSYNQFIGELRIPALPRGVLSTVNNKTDFNLNDAGWSEIFTILNKYRPEKNGEMLSEADLRTKWMNRLKSTNPNDIIDDEHYVWPTGTRIDVYQENHHGEITIYELKIGKGSPISLYQLKMYWDGLVLEGKQPTKGILFVGSYDDKLKNMADTINHRLTPPCMEINGEYIASKPYNLIIEKHSDRGLGRDVEQDY